MPIDNSMKSSALRLAATFYNFFSTCGCSPDNKKVFTPECYTLDLGVVYNEIKCYETDSPCPQCCYEYSEEEEPQCNEYPHGYVNNVGPICAKLIVFKNARVVNGVFEYESIIKMFSRQRQNLPRYNNCNLIYPLECPAENGLRNIPCYYTCTDGRERGSMYAGPYLNVETVERPIELTGCTGCRSIGYTNNEDWKSQEMGFGFSPCMLDSINICRQDGRCPNFACEEENANVVLAGYAIDDEPTWLLDAGIEPFSSVRQAIIDNDPLGYFPHTVYLHYELKTSLIRCCGQESGENRFLSGYADKEEREKSVMVQAALGFSCQLCGLDPDVACEKLYEE